MRKYFFIWLLISFDLSAQDTLPGKRTRPEIKGYIKYMDQFVFLEQPRIRNLTSILHNRIQLKYAPGNWNMRLEMRNRIFYGDQLKTNSGFMKSLGEDLGTMDLSNVWVDEYGWGFHSIIDRALLNYHNAQWEISLGRQRINWGLNTVWNPNDIFNTYNYFDFDYEERPGSDALRMQYQWKGFSAIELAAKKGKQPGDITAALLYRSNNKGYDFQILSGISQKDLLLGVGWAGNIKNSGFKGEATFFRPYGHLNDSSGTLSASITWDYSFNKGWYLMISGYHNSKGSSKMNILQTEQFFGSSAKQLLPFVYSGFIQISKQISPLMTAGLSQIYSPTNDTWILVPNIQYSLADNWELTLLGQVFYADIQGVYRSLGKSAFLRLKWSF